MGKEEVSLLLLGAGFELLGLGGAGVAVLLETSEELALADGLQIQVAVVVLAENGRPAYFLPLLYLRLTLPTYFYTYQIQVAFLATFTNYAARVLCN